MKNIIITALSIFFAMSLVLLGISVNKIKHLEAELKKQVPTNQDVTKVQGELSGYLNESTHALQNAKNELNQYRAALAQQMENYETLKSRCRSLAQHSYDWYKVRVKLKNALQLASQINNYEKMAYVARDLNSVSLPHLDKETASVLNEILGLGQ